MDEYTNNQLFEIKKSIIELEGKARVRKIWADTGKQLLRGLPFVVAALFFILSTHDRLTIVAALFLGIGGWLMMMLE